MTIDRFIVRCRVPRRVRIRHDAVAGEVRGAVTAALRERIAPLERMQGALRVPRVQVKVRITLEELARGCFGRKVADAVAAGLALAVKETPQNLPRKEERLLSLVRLMQKWGEGPKADSDFPAEFAALRGVSPGTALAALLSSEPELLLEALSELQRLGKLAQVLASCSAGELERLSAMLSNDTAAPGLSGLVSLADWASRDLDGGDGAPLATWARAIGFWLAEGAEMRLGIAPILDGLRALEAVAARPLEITHGCAGAIVDALNRAFSNGAPPWLGAAFATAVSDGTRGAFATAASALAARLDSTPAGVIEKNQAVTQTGEEWRVTGAAGLLFLVAVIERLGWRARALQLPGGVDAWPFILAGAAQTILGLPPAPREPLDPAVAVLAGWLDMPDSAGLLRYARPPVNDEPARLTSALGIMAAHAPAMWAEAFQAIGEALLRELAARLPGFSDAGTAFLVSNFIRCEGRLLVTERCVLVEIRRPDLHVVLDLAGCDQPVGSVSWWGGRRLDLHFVSD